MAEKTRFQKEFENAFTLKEAREILYKRIEESWKQPEVDEKTKFQMECERGVSIEEARAHSHEFIKQLWKK